MLKNISIDTNSNISTAASTIKDAWAENKVIHVTGIKNSDSKRLRDFYDELLNELGTPLAIGEDVHAERDAPRSGEQWMEIRYDPSIENAYRYSPNAQPLHTDGSFIPNFPDAAIIYCQSSATIGGNTIFLDSNELINSLTNENSKLLTELCETTVIHSRSGDTKTSPIINMKNGTAIISWNYYCLAKDQSKDVMDLAERFRNYLQSSESISSKFVHVPLEEGDCVLWKDDRTLHGRTAFEPKVKSERFLWKSAVQID